MENKTYFEQRNQNLRLIKKVSLITLVVNIVLTAFKSVIGILFFNVSVLSDAVHSASDIATTVLVIVSAAVSKPAGDKGHNYGHEKRESVITLFFALILAATGIGLAAGGISGLLNVQERPSVNPYLIGVTVFSIAVKEAMFWYTIRYAKKTRSDALKADAWHHRSDSLSSVAVLAGLLFGLWLKTNLAESIAVVIVALLIVKVAAGILRTAVGQLTDKAADERICGEITAAARAVAGVRGVDGLRTRLFGNAIYVDIEIAADGALSVEEAHKIADVVHDKIESLQEYRIKHCNVHVNPYTEEKDAETKQHADAHNGDAP